MAASILVVLCVDADPDRPEYGGSRYDCPDKLTWKWLPELASKIEKLRSEIWQTSGVRIQLTWFLRSDLQIRTIYGDAGWSLKQFEPIWKKMAETGDELAWHPHSWRWNAPSRCWYNDISDTRYIQESYDVGFDSFAEVMGFKPLACRAGINFHNNDSMIKLDELGVRVDLSAHPGIVLFYHRRKVGGHIVEGFDWGRTPEDPYHPSKEDYQSPSKSGRSLEILEIPMTTWRRPSGSLAYWKGLVPVRIRGRHHLVRPSVMGWFIPSAHGDSCRFEIAVEEVLRRAESRGMAHYASALHPDDLSDISYRRLAQNLDYIINTAERRHIDLKFLTASQAWKSVHPSC